MQCNAFSLLPFKPMAGAVITEQHPFIVGGLMVLLVTLTALFTAGVV